MKEELDMKLAEPFPGRKIRKPTAADHEKELEGFEAVMGMVG